MKLFAVLFVVCAVVGSIKGNTDAEQLKAIAAECQTETGATDEELATVFEHKPAVSDKQKCVRSCVMKKLGLLDEGNKLNKENVLALMKQLANGDAEKEKLADEILLACTDIKVPADACEAAEAYNICMIEKLGDKDFPKLKV